MLDAPGWPARPAVRRRGAAADRRAACPRTRWRRCATGCTRWPPTRSSAPPSSGRPSPARWRAWTAGSTAWPRRSTRQDGGGDGAARGRGRRLRRAPRRASTTAWRSGTLLRGEVLARWQEFVGTGEWMRSAGGPHRPAARPAHRLRHRPARPPADDLQGALESGVEQLLRVAADGAAERTVTAWRGTAGRPGAAGRPDARAGAVVTPASPRPPPPRCATGRAASSTWCAARAPTSAPPRGSCPSASTAPGGGDGRRLRPTGGLTGGEVAVAGGTSALGPAGARGGVRRRRRPRAGRPGPRRPGRAGRPAAHRRAGAASTSCVDAAAPPPGSAEELRAARGRAGRGAGRPRREAPGPRRPAAGRPAGRAARGGRGWPRRGSTCRTSAAPATCWPRPVPARRSATRPSSRWPAPPAAASRRCSTRWPAREVAHAGRAAADHRRRARHRLGRGRRRPAARLARGARAGTVSTGPDPALDGLVLLDLPDHDCVRLRAPAGGRPARRARRRAGLGARPAEVRRRRRARPLPARRWPGTPACSSSCSTRSTGSTTGARRPAWPTCAGCSTPRAWPTRPVLRRLGHAPATACPSCAPSWPSRVAARRAASDRLAADVAGRRRRAGRRTARGRRRCAASGRASEAALVGALPDAAGVPVVAARGRAVGASATASARTGWPLLRWVRRLRPDPLDRLHLGDERARTSLPTAGAVQHAAMTDALRQRPRRRRRGAAAGLARRAAADRGRRARPACRPARPGRRRHRPRRPSRAPLVARRRRAAVAAPALALVGAAVAAGAGRARPAAARRRRARRPRSGHPAAHAAAGGRAAGRALLAVVARPFVNAGARRRRRRAEQRLTARVAEVARASVLAPLDGTVEDARVFCAAVARAGS